MFEEIYNYFNKELSDYKLVFIYATRQEKLLLYVSFLSVVLYLKFPEGVLVGWFLIFIFILSWLFRRVIKRKYGFRVTGIRNCGELDILVRNKLRDFLSNKGLLNLAKIGIINEIIDSELRGQYSEKFSIPSGVTGFFLALISCYVGWILGRLELKSLNEVTRDFFIIFCIVTAGMILFYSAYSGLNWRRETLRRLKKNLDNIRLELTDVSD
jgi:hypothetical protein